MLPAHYWAIDKRGHPNYEKDIDEILHVVCILSNRSARSDNTEGIKRQPGSMFSLPLHGCWGVEGRSTPCALRRYRWCVLLSWQRAGKPRQSHLTGPGRAFSNKMHPGNNSGADYTFRGFRPCLGQFISTSPTLSRVCGLKLFKSFCWPINTILFKKY